MPDNVVATFVLALVGGEVRGRVVICATVILEGLNVSKANLQLKSICAFKFFGLLFKTMRTYHKRRSQRTLITTSGTFV